MVQITAINPTHANASVSQHVDVVFLLQSENLCGIKTRESEHPLLIDDVGPVARGFEEFQRFVQRLPHCRDSIRHRFQLLFPEVKVLKINGFFFYLIR